jgi:CBS domain-containing protein
VRRRLHGYGDTAGGDDPTKEVLHMAALMIRDVMTPDPIVLGPDATIREAAVAMRDASIGDVLVSDGDGLMGIVTDRDIVVRCIADGRAPDDVRLSEVCTGDLVTVTPDTTADDAVKKIRDRAIRRLPVVDQDRVVGIVTIGDLAIERDPESALADVSEAPPTD